MTIDRLDLLARWFARRMDRRAAALAGLAVAAAPAPVRAGTCRLLKATCKRGSQCCSGLCKGRKKMTCRAHDTGGCRPGEGGCGVERPRTTSEGYEGNCYTTSGQAGFCAFTGSCQPCQRDADCQAEFGPRAACILDCPANCPGPVTSACVTAGPIVHPMA
ncbi:MAG: hypothetical protein ACKOWF_15785 [Chloroflexota bacterium]